MIDEIFDRTYQAGRADLNAGIERAIGGAVRAAVSGFHALHRLQWSAPWRKERTDIGCA